MSVHVLDGFLEHSGLIQRSDDTGWMVIKTSKIIIYKAAHNSQKIREVYKAIAIVIAFHTNLLECLIVGCLGQCTAKSIATVDGII